MTLSIVTTLYKSSPYIDQFYTRISKEAQKITQDYEIIFVDDGSPDDSLQKAVTLYEKDSKVKVIELSRNFGHHKAIMTGLAHAKGEFVFLIDSDLDEEPELLSIYWSKLSNDLLVDVVSGKTHNIKKSFSHKAFYKVFNHLSQTKIPDNELVSRLMRRTYVKALLSYQEKNIFLPAMWNDIGFNIQFVETTKKLNTESSYTLLKKVLLSIDAIISFSTKPLFYLLGIGFFVFLLSFFIIVYLVIRKIIFAEIALGWTSVIASIWAVGGLIMFSLGLIGIYLAKNLSETKSRPLTIIKSIYSKQSYKE